jgi:DNA-binding response OmpR family regulator
MSAILLYWEDRTYHHALERILRRAGYDVIATDDMGYAMQVVSTIPVDLLVLEVASEQAPALRLLGHIRADRGCAAPAIVVSDIEDADVVGAARQLAADEFLLKRKSLLTELLDYVDLHASPKRAWRPEVFVPGTTLRYRPS